MEQWRVMRNQNESSELKHYGVKGMRWGVRKEYELKGRKKSTKLNAVTLTKKSSSGDSTIHINDKEDYAQKERVVDFISDKAPDRYASETEALYKFKNLPRFNMRLSEEQQRQAVNHNAPDYDRQVNCFECCLAYEMRRRGYNVQANKLDGGYSVEVLHAFDVKNSFTINVTSQNSTLSNEALARECYSQIEEQCLKYGEGARGMLAMYYAEPYDGGHGMSWVVENGEFKIIDNQSNMQEGYDTFLMCDSDVDVYRLDNAEVLPGVTDFVEPFEATVKEEFASKKAYNNAKKVWKKEGYADEYKESGMKTFEKIIKDVGKNISEFVSKGKEIVSNFLKTPFGIQKNETTTTGNGGFTKKS